MTRETNLPAWPGQTKLCRGAGLAIILSIRITKNILITRRDCNLAVISDITSQDDTIYIDKAGTTLQPSSQLGMGEIFYNLL